MLGFALKTASLVLQGRGASLHGLLIAAARLERSQFTLEAKGVQGPKYGPSFWPDPCPFGLHVWALGSHILDVWIAEKKNMKMEYSMLVLLLLPCWRVVMF